MKGEPQKSLIKLNILMFECWHTQLYLGPRRFKKKIPLGRIHLIYLVLLSLNSVKPAKLANEGKLWSVLAQSTFSFHNNLASDHLTLNLKVIRFQRNDPTFCSFRLKETYFGLIRKIKVLSNCNVNFISLREFRLCYKWDLKIVLKCLCFFDGNLLVYQLSENRTKEIFNQWVKWLNKLLLLRNWTFWCSSCKSFCKLQSEWPKLTCKHD